MPETNSNLKEPSNHELAKFQRNDLTYLWAEYQYRHDLIWRTVFKITATVVTLSILPYVNKNLTADFRFLLRIPPFLGCLLGIFGCFVIHSELCLFYRIKRIYRDKQRLFFDYLKRYAQEYGEDLNISTQEYGKDYFSFFVWVFIIVLNILAFGNLFVSCNWISKL